LCNIENKMSRYILNTLLSYNISIKDNKQLNSQFTIKLLFFVYETIKLLFFVYERALIFSYNSLMLIIRLIYFLFHFC